MVKDSDHASVKIFEESLSIKNFPRQNFVFSGIRALERMVSCTGGTVEEATESRGGGGTLLN